MSAKFLALMVLAAVIILALIIAGLYIQYLRYEACLNYLHLPWWACLSK